MAILNDVPQTAPNSGGNFAQVWLQFFSSVFLLLNAVQTSGPTSGRPTTNLWIGMPYFDTTVGSMINLKSTGPNVWVNGIGTVV